MINDIRLSPLYPMVNPESIAFFGASNNFSAMGSTIFSSLRKAGFPGRLYPVHPKEKVVQGIAAFEKVEDLPQTPDLAVFVLPTRLVCETLEACGAKGIRHVIIVTAGFREVGGAGVELEKKLVETAKKWGIRFLGPNCIGVTNPHKLLNTTFMRSEGSAGFIGLASQSGSFVTQMFNYLDRFKVGFSTAFSVGNSADVDIVDCLEYLGACPHTKVIALYVEGLVRGRLFVETARRISTKKPIVALYVGGSETGRKAGLSHTGTMAGPDRLYDGIFRQAGVVRARSVTELFDFARALGSLPPADGKRVVIQTHSGGPGAAAADACGRTGLEVPPLLPNTLEKLSAFVPHTGSIANPVDITYSKNPMDFFSQIPSALLEDENADMLLVYYLVPLAMVLRPIMSMGLDEETAAIHAAKWLDEQAQSLADLMARHNKPIAGFTFRSITEHFPQALMGRGIPVFQGPERAVRALWACYEYARLKSRLLA
ncbi:MAG: CoA-binding protein [Desulfatibacillaceae bacterium]|nr:CoA-binding protein [Desulfatibacillaceae bacterium]